MTTIPAFRPVLYAKHGCPFCLKVRLFALEANISERLEIREFAPGSVAETAIRGELEQVLDKVGFPTVQFAPGRYVAESDDIVAELSAMSGRRPETLPVYNTYATEVLPSLVALYRENHALKSPR